MAVKLTFDLPADLEEKIRGESSSLEADVKEAFILSLFRQGRLTHYEVSCALGLDRFETDALLKQQGIYEGSLTTADLDSDTQTLTNVLRKAS